MPLKMAVYGFTLLSQLFMYVLHYFVLDIVSFICTVKCFLLFCFASDILASGWWHFVLAVAVRLLAHFLSMCNTNCRTCVIVLSLQQSFEPIRTSYWEYFEDIHHGKHFRLPKERKLWVRSSKRARTISRKCIHSGAAQDRYCYLAVRF